MAIVRGRLATAGRLPQPTLRVGSPSSLRFQDGAVVDAEGREVKTVPFLPPPVKGWHRVPTPVPPLPPRPAPTRVPGVGIGAEDREPIQRGRFEVHPYVFIFAALVAGYCLGLLRATLAVSR